MLQMSCTTIVLLTEIAFELDTKKLQGDKKNLIHNVFSLK